MSNHAPTSAKRLPDAPLEQRRRTPILVLLVLVVGLGFCLPSIAQAPAPNSGTSVEFRPIEHLRRYSSFCLTVSLQGMLNPADSSRLQGLVQRAANRLRLPYLTTNSANCSPQRSLANRGERLAVAFALFIQPNRSGWIGVLTATTRFPVAGRNSYDTAFIWQYLIFDDREPDREASQWDVVVNAMLTAFAEDWRAAHR